MKKLYAVVLLILSTSALADAGHDKPKATDMNGMDHSKMEGMDHSKMDMSGGHWMAPPAMAKRANPVKATPASIARGKKLYAANCASCHGEKGAGDGPAGAALNPKPANLATMAPQHPAGDLAWKIENGRGAMPAWKGTLKQNQIWDVVNFLQKSAGPRASGREPGDGHTGHAH